MRALRSHLTDARRARRYPLHLLLLLGMLVPLLGATAAGGAVVHDQYEVRSASLALESRAADLALQTQFVSALAAEETHSNVLALAAGYDEDTNASAGIDLDVTRARIAGARAVVDSDRFAGIRSTLGVDPPLSYIDTATLAGRLADGARWAILLTDVVRAAAVELEEAASVHADWAQRTHPDPAARDGCAHRDLARPRHGHGSGDHDPGPAARGSGPPDRGRRVPAGPAARSRAT